MIYFVPTCPHLPFSAPVSSNITLPEVQKGESPLPSARVCSTSADPSHFPFPSCTQFNCSHVLLKLFPCKCCVCVSLAIAASFWRSRLWAAMVFLIYLQYFWIFAHYVLLTYFSMEGESFLYCVIHFTSIQFENFDSPLFREQKLEDNWTIFNFCEPSWLRTLASALHVQSIFTKPLPSLAHSHNLAHVSSTHRLWVTYSPNPKPHHYLLTIKTLCPYASIWRWRHQTKNTMQMKRQMCIHRTITHFSQPHKKCQNKTPQSPQLSSCLNWNKVNHNKLL